MSTHAAHGMYLECAARLLAASGPTEAGFTIRSAVSAIGVLLSEVVPQAPDLLVDLVAVGAWLLYAALVNDSWPFRAPSPRTRAA